jgi:hypothetical protein
MCDASLQQILLISTPVSGDHMHSPVVESHAFGLKPGYGRLLHEQLLITSSLCRLRDRLRLLVYVPDAVSAFLALAWATFS